MRKSDIFNRNAAKEQPQPSGDGKPVIQEVIQDILAREQKGIQTYGTTLKTNNGRDSLLDAYQEVLDLAIYLKQKIMEDDSTNQQGQQNKTS